MVEKQIKCGHEIDLIVKPGYDWCLRCYEINIAERIKTGLLKCYKMYDIDTLFDNAWREMVEEALEEK